MHALLLIGGLLPLAAMLLALLVPTVDTTVAAWVPVTSPTRGPLKFVALSAVPARKANGSVVNGVRLETRLIWKRPTGRWYLTTYRWSADESRTDELTAGETGADAGSYEIPTQNNCFDCHSGRQDVVLGFEAVALSSPGASGITMATLKAENLLTAPPTAPLVIKK